LPLSRLHQRNCVQPDRCDAARPVGQGGHDRAGGHFPGHPGAGDRPGGQHLEVAVLGLPGPADRLDAQPRATASPVVAVSAAIPAPRELGNAPQPGTRRRPRRGPFPGPADWGIRYRLRFAVRPHWLRPVTAAATGCTLVTGLGPVRWMPDLHGFWRVLGKAAGLGHASFTTFAGTPRT